MSKKSCPICGKEDSVSDMLYCPNCEMFFCRRHADRGGIFGTGEYRCPRCKKEVAD